MTSTAASAGSCSRRSSPRRGASSRCARASVPLDEIERRAARGGAEPRRVQAGARRASGRVNVIAECKRRSPSRGVLRPDYDPAAIASGYERAGAAAISVLTEPAFFDGALDHLTAVRAATPAAASPQRFHRRSLPDSRSAGGGRRRHSADRRGAERGCAEELHRDGDGCTGWTCWSRFTIWHELPVALDAWRVDRRREQPQSSHARRSIPA